MRRRTFLGLPVALLATPCEALSRLDDLWDRTVRPSLSDDLWSPDFAYPAGHAFMAPLHAAFRLGRTDYIRSFHDHFARFVQADRQDLATCRPEEELTRLHYLLLASWYCRLAHDAGQPIPTGLVERVWREVAALHMVKSAWWFAPESFKGGSRARIAWKLANYRDFTELRARDFYGAIHDTELFSLAALCNLRVPAWAALKSDYMDVCNDAALLLGRIVRERGVFRAGGWLFQPGAWASHPGYAYHGHSAVLPHLKPLPRAGESDDSSHSFRWPLHLRSLIANALTAEESAAGRAAHAALGRQIYEVVWVRPTRDFPAPRMTNYLDGWNGIYRYSHEANSPPKGYGPYGLSGSLTVGWWGFLDHPNARPLWQEFSSCFPLSREVVTLYSAAGTGYELLAGTQRQHPLMEWPAYFTNGFAELNVRLFAEAGLNVPP